MIIQQPGLMETVAEAVETSTSTSPSNVVGSAATGALRPSGSIVAHICDVIEKLREERPGPNSSFASLGLDSLGSIMFVNTLSVSLDGISIDPTSLYSPGLTIQSFADQLRVRLTIENPTLLEKIESQVCRISFAL